MDCVARQAPPVYGILQARILEWVVIQPWEEPQGAGVVPVVAAGCRLDMSAGGGASAVVGRALGGASEEGWARRRRTARGKGRGARRVAPRFLPWAQPAFRAPTQSQAASSP